MQGACQNLRPQPIDLFFVKNISPLFFSDVPHPHPTALMAAANGEGWVHAAVPRRREKLILSNYIGLL